MIIRGNNVEPISFREEDISICHDFDKMSKSKKVQKITFSNDLISIYYKFQELIYNPSLVLYPSSEFNASSARVFKNVTFVDIENRNGRGILKLKETGLHALK